MKKLRRALKRNNTNLSILGLLFTIVFLSACGPSQAEIDAAATQVAIAAIATQTAAAPTPIPTVEEPTQVPTVAPQTINLSDGEELVLNAGTASYDPLKLTKGFGVEGQEISSPGPTIKVRKGESVTITFENTDFYPDGRPAHSHNFVVVADKDIFWSEMEPLWGAYVGSFAPLFNIKPGDRGSVTFTAEDAGNFFYVCRIGPHIEAGMWGRFIVEE